MSAQNLIDFASDNSTMLDIVGSEDALFVCSFIARNGYTQTAEFRQAIDGKSSQIRSIVERLVRIGFIVYQDRTGGVFNGWVATTSGISFLRSLGLITDSDYQHEHFGGVTDEIENALQAQRRHGHRSPSIAHVLTVVRSVPPDRQEWLAFAICYEPVPDDELDSMLKPSPNDVQRLLPATENELDKIPTEAWPKWSKAVSKPAWSLIQ